MAATESPSKSTPKTSLPENPVGLEGVAFMEFSCMPDSPQGAAYLDKIFKGFGLSKRYRHPDKKIELYEQNRIHALVNQEPGSHGRWFAERHGTSVCAMGWRVKDAKAAYDIALQRGAKPYQPQPGITVDLPFPAIHGIGDTLIYFVDGDWGVESLYGETFVPLDQPEEIPEKGFMFIDHLTNNVEKGTMAGWVDFYKGIFGFTEVRYFDIKGKKTGLTSFALRSPCGMFSIPINEGTEEKSQIEEYLREHHGAGIQHIAFLTNDLLDSLDHLESSGIETLDIDPDYYEEAFQRVPNVTEDREHIKRHQVLIDGDEEGYLLQIFTKNLFGPLFIEMIQRKNHHSFGEGNFGALFKSIERDQERRGVL